MSLTDEALPDFDLEAGEDETDACIRRAEIAGLMTMEDEMTEPNHPSNHTECTPIDIAKVTDSEVGIDVSIVTCVQCGRVWVAGWTPNTTHIETFDVWEASRIAQERDREAQANLPELLAVMSTDPGEPAEPLHLFDDLAEDFLRR